MSEFGRGVRNSHIIEKKGRQNGHDLVVVQRNPLEKMSKCALKSSCAFPREQVITTCDVPPTAVGSVFRERCFIYSLLSRLKLSVDANAVWKLATHLIRAYLRKPLPIAFGETIDFVWRQGVELLPVELAILSAI